MAGLEEHREHLLPELERFDLLAVDFALARRASRSGRSASSNFLP